MRQELEEMKELFKKRNGGAGWWKVAAVSAIIGLLIFAFMRNAKDAEICSIAVSEDGRYFAYLQNDSEGGDEQLMLRCLTSDGHFQYEANLTEYSVGGSGAVWYEEENLCAELFRGDCIRVFSPEGTLLEVRSPDTPPEESFPGFSSNVGEHSYEGENFKLVYSRAGFFSWFFLSSPRRLTLYPASGDPIIIWNADKENGITDYVG
ncbi:MAG: hypothetical protein ACI377_03780 [Bacteroides fragilis]